MPAAAQNSFENAPVNQKAEYAEFERINRERASSAQELEQRRKACYQELAVTPCLNEARDQHNEKTRDLKRQEVMLNDTQRKRAASDRLRAIEERNSSEAQLEQAQRRGRALASSAKREEDRMQRQNSREGKQPAAKLTPQQRPDQAAKIEKNRQKAADREKEAGKRRAAAVQREAKRKKPAASSLPIPR